MFLCSEVSDELAQLPGLGGLTGAPIPSHIAMSGGALPPLQPGQVNPPPGGQPGGQPPTTLPQQIPPGQVPPGIANLPPAVQQLMMQGQQQAQQAQQAQHAQQAQAAAHQAAAQQAAMQGMSQIRINAKNYVNYLECSFIFSRNNKYCELDSRLTPECTSYQS